LWAIAALLDWEFAVPGSPLADIGHFLLRHERRSMDIIEPAFVNGYIDAGMPASCPRIGGVWPDYWT
jgi:Phosphotransferase enzyme family